MCFVCVCVCVWRRRFIKRKTKKCLWEVMNKKIEKKLVLPLNSCLRIVFFFFFYKKKMKLIKIKIMKLIS